MASTNIDKYKAEMKRLKKKVMEDRKEQPWEKPFDPAYAKFLADVRAIATPDVIPDKPLYGLWYYSKDFQKLWTDRVNPADRSNQELSLFVRFINRGLDDEKGTMLLHAWWTRHKYRINSAKLDYVEKVTIPAAKDFAQKTIRQKREAQDRERRERSRQKTKFRIMQVLFVAPSGPTEISSEIGEPVASVKMQLSRMADSKEVKRIKRGVYTLWKISPELRQQLKRTAKLPKLSEFDALLYRLWKQEESWRTPGDFIELLHHKDRYEGMIAYLKQEYPFEFTIFDDD